MKEAMDLSLCSINTIKSYYKNGYKIINEIKEEKYEKNAYDIQNEKIGTIALDVQFNRPQGSIYYNVRKRKR
jgi:hypothetical protein